MKNLLSNWKTTSAGLAMIISSVIHLAFAIKSKVADEAAWTTGLMGVVGGVGLLAAGDSSKSEQAHDESKAAIQELKENVATVVKTGDTSILTKADTTKGQ